MEIIEKNKIPKDTKNDNLIVVDLTEASSPKKEFANSSLPILNISLEKHIKKDKKR